MSELKCPYCPETCPRRACLDEHVTATHGTRPLNDVMAAADGPHVGMVSLPKLKCPYCPETRSAPSRLATHVDVAHNNVTVEEVVIEGFQGLTVQPIEQNQPTGPITIESSEQAIAVQCVCGAPIEPLNEDTTYPEWTHVFAGSTGKCKDAIPAAGMPTKADRESLNVALDRTDAGLAKASREVSEMRAALDAVDERMRKLDAQLTSPATVRRATLNQVWDKLVGAGNLSGAATVMKMINQVVDDA